MVKLIFLTFFIVEIVFAGILILKIYKTNMAINSLSTKLTKNKYKIKSAIIDVKDVAVAFNAKLNEAKIEAMAKKEEQMYNIVRNILTFLITSGFKRMFKKQIYALEIASEVYEVVQEINAPA